MDVETRVATASPTGLRRALLLSLRLTGLVLLWWLLATTAAQADDDERDRPGGLVDDVTTSVADVADRGSSGPSATPKAEAPVAEPSAIREVTSPATKAIRATVEETGTAVRATAENTDTAVRTTVENTDTAVRTTVKNTEAAVVQVVEPVVEPIVTGVTPEVVEEELEPPGDRNPPAPDHRGEVADPHADPVSADRPPSQGSTGRGHSRPRSAVSHSAADVSTRTLAPLSDNTAPLPETMSTAPDQVDAATASAPGLPSPADQPIVNPCNGSGSASPSSGGSGGPAHLPVDPDERGVPIVWIEQQPGNAPAPGPVPVLDATPD